MGLGFKSVGFWCWVTPDVVGACVEGFANGL